MSSIFDDIKENIHITQSLDQTPHHVMEDVHYHDCYEIIFFLSDNISYFVKDEIYPIVKYDLIFIPPFTIHKVTQTDGKYYERIVINLDRKSVV